MATQQTRQPILHAGQRPWALRNGEEPDGGWQSSQAGPGGGIQAKRRGSYDIQAVSRVVKEVRELLPPEGAGRVAGRELPADQDQPPRGGRHTRPRVKRLLLLSAGHALVSRRPARGTPRASREGWTARRTPSSISGSVPGSAPDRRHTRCGPRCGSDRCSSSSSPARRFPGSW